MTKFVTFWTIIEGYVIFEFNFETDICFVLFISYEALIYLFIFVNGVIFVQNEYALDLIMSTLLFRKDKISYSRLKDQVSRVAGLLSRLGVGRGDRVLIYMPMVPEAIVAMLATIRLGAVHSVVFGGFAAKELSTRIKHAEPKVLILIIYKKTF